MTLPPDPRRPRRALRIRRASLVTLTLLALGGASLAAQYPGGYGPPGGSGGGGFGGGMGGQGHRGRGQHYGGAAFSMPTDQELAGPLSPEALKGVLSLSDEQVQRYQPLWEQHMQATKPQRDSAQAALAGAQRAMQDHDRTAMHQYGPVLHRLVPDLEDRDKQFADKQLKPILTKDQAKSFDKWRDEQKRVADDERRQYGRS